VAQLKSTLREDAEWNMTRWICASYAGNAANPNASCSGCSTTARLRASMPCSPSASRAPRGRRKEVTIEWNGVDELTPWRFALSRALGVDLPEGLRSERRGASTSPTC
jgi:hypothetical protein